MSQSKTDDKSNEKENKAQDSESTSQYKMRPEKGKSFPVAGIREIINEVLLQTLDGK